ncbi:MAG: ComF family protein [Chloroflexi bacterium]|nr:ComF family protein [Chloroflexota bacterium]
MGEALAEPLIGYFASLGWEIGLVVPVPLGRARLKERGYNQADLIAKPLALASGARYSRSGLVRIRETESQVGLNIIQRRENVAEAFYGNRALVASKKVLVIDDVTTTGATISACADALQNAGAAAVYGLTLARAVSRKEP